MLLFKLTLIMHRQPGMKNKIQIMQIDAFGTVCS